MYPNAFVVIRGYVKAVIKSKHDTFRYIFKLFFIRKLIKLASTLKKIYMQSNCFFHFLEKKQKIFHKMLSKLNQVSGRKSAEKEKIYIYTHDTTSVINS